MKKGPAGYLKPLSSYGVFRNIFPENQHTDNNFEINYRKFFRRKRQQNGTNRFSEINEILAEDYKNFCILPFSTYLFCFLIYNIFLIYLLKIYDNKQ